MSQHKLLFISPLRATFKKRNGRKLLAILAFTAIGVTVACEDGFDEPYSSSEGAQQRQEEVKGRFGVIERDTIKNWSALWHMAETGSIQFCIINKAYHAEEDEDAMISRLKDKLEYAVDAWTSLLKKDPPDGSFPSWKRSSIAVRFGCSGDYYDITISYSGSSVGINTRSARMNIHYKQISEKPVAHEFGHMMGLADTYKEGHEEQPDSMMKSLVWSDDDKFAIWALWKFLKTGVMSCGPGYIENSHGQCIPGSDPEEEPGSACTPLHEQCKTNDDCCTGLECKVRAVGEPPICSAKPKTTKTRIDDDHGGAAGRR